MLAAGGLALLLLFGVTAPAGAEDYPIPPPPPTSVLPHQVSNPLPRTGSDHTTTLVLVGGGVLLAGAGLVLVSKRQHAKASEA